MLCSQVQVVATTEGLPLPATFSVQDVVEVMGYGVGEDGKLVAYRKMINVEEEHCMKL